MLSSSSVGVRVDVDGILSSVADPRVCSLAVLPMSYEERLYCCYVCCIVAN